MFGYNCLKHTSVCVFPMFPYLIDCHTGWTVGLGWKDLFGVLVFVTEQAAHSQSLNIYLTNIS